MEFHLFLLVTCLSSLAVAQNSVSSPNEAGTWAVEDGNTTCILVSFDATLNITYPVLFAAGSINFTKPEETLVTLPRNAVVDGQLSSCSPMHQRIVLRWPGHFPHKLSIEFTEESENTVVKSVSFEYYLADSNLFPNTTSNSVATARSNEKALLKFPATSYWQCETGKVMQLEAAEEEPYGAVLNVTNVRLEAFRNSSDKAFNGVAQICAEDPSTTTTSTTTTSTTTTSTTTTTTTTTTSPTTTSAETTTSDSTTTPWTVPTTTLSPPPSAVWSVKNSTTGDYCVLAFFDAQFTIFYNATYPAAPNTTHIAPTHALTLPSTATVDQGQSFCDAGTMTPLQRIVLQWGTTYKYNLSLTFTQEPLTNRTVIKEAKLQYDLNDATIFPDRTPQENTLMTAVSTGQVGTIGNRMYMQCLTGFTTMMKIEDRKDVNATMAWSNVRLQAFRNLTTTTFDGPADVCQGDSHLTTPTPVVPTTSAPAPPLIGAFYNLTYPDNSQCLMVHFDLSITAMYYKKDATVGNGTIASVNNGTINHTLSSCNHNRSVLVIENFLPGWRLRMQFDNSSGKAYMSQVQLLFNLHTSWKFPDADPHANITMNATSLSRWSSPLGHSYKCLTRQDTLKLDTAGQRAVESMTLYLNQVKLRAFVPWNETIRNGTQSWGQEDECGMDILTNDIVPIAVGCALAALVVIVLIAYVIGRRRNRARGYESM